MLTRTLTLLLITNLTYAKGFDDLRNGFQTLSENYLSPLVFAVAGASALLFCILSFFDMDQYKRKVAGVLGLSIFASVVVGLVSQIMQSFGGRAF